jgi:hypothetical protein
MIEVPDVLPADVFEQQVVTQGDRHLDDADWLVRFHAGERAVIDQCYRRYARMVRDVAAHIVAPVDAETIVHEIFFSLLSDARVRTSFRGDRCMRGSAVWRATARSTCSASGSASTSRIQLRSTRSPRMSRNLMTFSRRRRGALSVGFARQRFRPSSPVCSKHAWFRL